MSEAANRPVPTLTPENEFFWTSGAEGVLRFRHCTACGALQHPPGPICADCRSTDLDVVDVSGRPYCVHTGEPEGQEFVTIGGSGVGYVGSLTRHVFETLAHHAQIALHVRVLAGRDPHHIVETQFKAVARALRDAVALDPRESGVPSTKGTL